MNMHEPVRVVAAEAAPSRGEAPVETLAAQALQLRPEFAALERTIDGNRLTARVELAGAGRRRCRRSATCAPSTTPASPATSTPGRSALQLDWMLYDGGIRDAQRQLADAQRARERGAARPACATQVRDDVDNARARARRPSDARSRRRDARCELSQGDARRWCRCSTTPAPRRSSTSCRRRTRSSPPRWRWRRRASICRSAACSSSALSGTFPANLKLEVTDAASDQETIMSDATTVDNGATGASRSRFIPLAVIAVLALGYGGYRFWQAHQPYEWSGTVEARTISVGSRAGGRVKEVLVREGDRVKAGPAAARCSSRAICDAQRLQAQGQLDAGAGDARQAGEGRAPRGDRAGAGARADGDGRARSRRRPARGASRSPAAEARLQAQQVAVDKAQLDAERCRQLFARGAAVAGRGRQRRDARCARRWRSATRSSSSSTSSRTARAARSCSRPRRARAEARASRAAGRGRLARRGHPGRARRRSRPRRAARPDRRACSTSSRSARRAPRASRRSTCGPATSSRRTPPRRRCSRTISSTCASTCPRRRSATSRVGQEVPITVDSFPGKTFKGVVEHINSVGEYSPRNLQTADERADQVFATRIGLARRARASCAPAWPRSSRCPSELTDADAERSRSSSSGVHAQVRRLRRARRRQPDGARPAWSTACSARTARASRRSSASCAACSRRRAGTATRARPRRRHAGRGDPPADRLHEPEVRALRRSHGAREPRLLRARLRPLRRAPAASAATPRSSSRTSGPTSTAAPACSRAAGSSGSRSAPR